MSIRTATAQDLPNIKALLQRCELPTADLDEACVAFLVAERDGQVTGAIGLQRFDRVALLRSLAVDAAHRGNGTAAALVTLLENEARQQEIDELILLTQTARQFFSRRGYSVIGRETAPPAVRQAQEFRSLCPASATCMAKSLR